MEAKILSIGLEKHLWSYILHDETGKCDRCYRSTRPICSRCHHSLSGEVRYDNARKINMTVCEVCNTVCAIESYA